MDCVVCLLNFCSHFPLELLWIPRYVMDSQEVRGYLASVFSTACTEVHRVGQKVYRRFPGIRSNCLQSGLTWFKSGFLASRHYFFQDPLLSSSPLKSWAACIWLAESLEGLRVLMDAKHVWICRENWQIWHPSPLIQETTGLWKNCTNSLTFHLYQKVLCSEKRVFIYV